MRSHHYVRVYRENININDALGDYSLTLVDALDSLAVSLYVQCMHKIHLVFNYLYRSWGTTVNSNMLSSWSSNMYRLINVQLFKYLRLTSGEVTDTCVIVCSNNP